MLNVLSMEGYLVVNAIIGGQTLAEVSPHLDATLGIVIIALISLIVRARLAVRAPARPLTSQRPTRSPSAATKSSTGASPRRLDHRARRR